MAYIVDLVVIMHSLFWHVRSTQEQGQAVSLDLDVLNEVLEPLYKQGGIIGRIHTDIKEFVEMWNFVDFMRFPDGVLTEVIRLIGKYAVKQD